MSEPAKFERVVELHSTVGTSLILCFPTGIAYTNQAGGTSCLQPIAEGVLISFENDWDLEGNFLSLEIDLYNYFQQVWQGTGATSGLTIRDADSIDELLRNRQLINWFHVDRDLLQSSMEAWVHVSVLGDHPFYCHGFGPYPRNAILTWANSD